MKRFDIYLLSLATQADHLKTRPCVIISPDEMNRHLPTVIIAPVAPKAAGFPSHIAFEGEQEKGFILLEQMGTVPKASLMKKLGSLSEATAKTVSERLVEMFVL